MFEERGASDISDETRDDCSSVILLVLIKDVESFYCAHGGNLSCEPCAWEDVRSASWGSLGGELPELERSLHT